MGQWMVSPRQECESTPLDRLKDCRLALAGTDEQGRKIHPGMFDAGVISLAHGDGTRRPPPGALRAGVEALLDPALCAFDDYLFLQRFEALEDRVSQNFRQAGIPAESADNICIECGTTRLFGAFLHCAAEQGDLFLAAPTYYHSLPDWCACFGAELVCVPTSPHEAYKLTVPALEAWFEQNVATGRQRKPRGLFLFNPTQTGGLYSSAELSELARFIADNDLIVLADHVFASTEFPGSPPAAYLAAQDGMTDRVVTLGGVSKSHNLANIRIGWACGPRQLIEEMRRYSVSTIISVPRLNKIMALAALDDDRKFLNENAKECLRRVRLIQDCIAHWNTELHRHAPNVPGFRLVHRPRAGHSLLLSCDALKGCHWSGGKIRNNVDVTRFFLSEARVAVSPAYSSGLDGCEIRICFASVGLSETYFYSSETECRAVVDGVRSHLRKESALPIAATSFSNGNHAPEAPVNQMFLHGRTMIHEAMIERMLPAILKVVGSKEKNHDQATVHEGGT